MKNFALQMLTLAAIVAYVLLVAGPLTVGVPATMSNVPFAAFVCAPLLALSAALLYLIGSNK